MTCVIIPMEVVMAHPEEAVLEPLAPPLRAMSRVPRGGPGRPHVLRKLLRLSQEDFARLLDVRVRTVARWEVGEAEPNPATREKLQYLVRLAKTLENVMDRGHIAQWLTTPNPEFLDQPPLDLVQSQYGRRVLETEIERAEWGIPG
jgi:transcriptional regulator with XRE-family HTH domain